MNSKKAEEEGRRRLDEKYKKVEEKVNGRRED